MDDGATNVCESTELLNVKKSYRKRISVSKQRPNKNTLRRFRRKRSKTRYHKSLKQVRYNRNTDDLCSGVQFVDITDMEWAPSGSTNLPSEVTEWQQQDEIAYWKSRAISLELENRMLHQHLRNVYAKTIEQYSQNKDISTNDEEVVESQPEENQYIIEEEFATIQSEKKQYVSRKKSDAISNSKRPVSPKVPIGKNRFEEMNKIYGDKAQKIMGMETALQLNYEKQIQQLKPSCWPNIPFRLKFD